MFRKLLMVVLALTASLASTAQVFAQNTPDSSPSGAVYILSNSSSGNQVLAFQRAADGSLTPNGTFDTGGLGSGVGITVPPDPLGSQNSIIVSPDGKWVFAVNAGSDEISVLKVTRNGLRLTDKVNSSGSYPVSLTFSDDLLYVLNAAGDGSISGFKFDDGRLKSLSNSTRTLNAATPKDGNQPNILEAPAQVGFTPDGRFLVVTNKGGVSGVGLIQVFSVSKGRPSDQPQATQTAGPVPFSFTFDRFGHLIVVDAAQGTVTSYGIQSDGSAAVLDTAFTNQAATCWIKGNSRYVFTDNTGSGTLSGFQTSKSGKLTPVTANSIVANSGPGTLPLDMGVSADGRFVYSLEAGAGKIAIFQVIPDGTLVSLGVNGDFLPITGFQGIAVY
jgi:6-phosphogluconolactonase